MHSNMLKELLEMPPSEPRPTRPPGIGVLLQRRRAGCQLHVADGAVGYAGPDLGQHGVFAVVEPHTVGQHRTGFEDAPFLELVNRAITEELLDDLYLFLLLARVGVDMDAVGACDASRLAEHVLGAVRDVFEAHPDPYASVLCVVVAFDQRPGAVESLEEVLGGWSAA